MGEHCNLFIGTVANWREVQCLFEEEPDCLFEVPDAGEPPEFLTSSPWYRELEELGDDEFDEMDDDERPNCLAGALLGFDWYDHDWVDYVRTDGDALAPEPFFAHPEVGRITSWEIPDLDAVRRAVEELGVSSLNFVFHIGDDFDEGEIERGKRAELADGKYLMYLGRFSGGGSG